MQFKGRISAGTHGRYWNKEAKANREFLFLPASSWLLSTHLLLLFLFADRFSLLLISWARQIFPPPPAPTPVPQLISLPLETILNWNTFCCSLFQTHTRENLSAQPGPRSNQAYKALNSIGPSCISNFALWPPPLHSLNSWQAGLLQFLENDKLFLSLPGEFALTAPFNKNILPPDMGVVGSFSQSHLSLDGIASKRPALNLLPKKGIPCPSTPFILYHKTLLISILVLITI